jgi:hypothetical protein
MSNREVVTNLEDTDREPFIRTEMCTELLLEKK